MRHDFDKDFEETEAEFHEHFKSMRKMAGILLFIQVTLLIVVFGFVGWVIYSILHHFGIM